MTANANAICAESKMSGRHYITFRDSKHAAFQNSVSKTRQIIFPQQRISILLGKSGYVGLDVHKKQITYCILDRDGATICEGDIMLTRERLTDFAKNFLHVIARVKTGQ